MDTRESSRVAAKQFTLERINWTEKGLEIKEKKKANHKVLASREENIEKTRANNRKSLQKRRKERKNAQNAEI